MNERVKKGMGYLPQESSVFRKLTVEENILAILELLDISRDEQKKAIKKFIGGFWSYVRSEEQSIYIIRRRKAQG